MGKKLPEGVAALNRLFYYYKKDAKRKGRKFELTREQFERLTKLNCFYCGSLPSSSMLYEVIEKKLNGDYIYNGIDRIDNNKDYTIDNVVACCKKCNFMKGKMEINEFITHVEKIAKRQNIL